MAYRIVKIIHKAIAYACFTGMGVLLLMMLLTTSDVLSRALFNRPITAAYEISQYMLVIVILLGIGYTQQIGQHVRVGFFTDKLNPRSQLALDIFFTLIAFVFFVLVAWQGWEGGFKAIYQKTGSMTLHIPSYPFEFLIVVGAVLLSIELLLKLITSIKNLKDSVAGREILE